MLYSHRPCIATVNNIRFSPCNSCFLQMDHKISPANQNSTVKVVKKQMISIPVTSHFITVGYRSHTVLMQYIPTISNSRIRWLLESSLFAINIRGKANRQISMRHGKLRDLITPRLTYTNVITYCSGYLLFDANSEMFVDTSHTRCLLVLSRR